MNKRVETFAVDLATAVTVPLLESVLKQSSTVLGNQSDEAGICIWGGAAANALLMISGKTRRNYTHHDIEFFDTSAGCLAANKNALLSIQNGLRQDRIFLDLGGLSIATERRGQSVTSFQAQRIALEDGDLELNNVLIEWTIGSALVKFSAPEGTAANLRSAAPTISAKPSTELKRSDRIARRLYRNISKAVRLELSCNTTIDDNLIDHTEDLIVRYIDSLSLESDGNRTPEWLMAEGVFSQQDAISWLCTRVLSELLKRTIRLIDSGSEISEGIYLRAMSGESGLLRHKLLKQLLSVANIDITNFEHSVFRNEVGTYLQDLKKYAGGNWNSEARCLDSTSPFPRFEPVIFHTTGNSI